MSVRDEHIELVRRGLALVEHREFDQLRSGMTDDVVWAGAITRSPIQGADQVVGEMKKFAEDYGVKTEFDSVDYFADEDQVVAHEHVRMTRDGRTVDSEAVHIFEFRGDKISKVTVFTGDPQRMAAFFA